MTYYIPEIVKKQMIFVSCCIMLFQNISFFIIIALDNREKAVILNSENRKEHIKVHV